MMLPTSKMISSANLADEVLVVFQGSLDEFVDVAATGCEASHSLTGTMHMGG